MKGRHTFLLAATIVLISCKFECQMGNTDKKDETKENASTNKPAVKSEAKTLNDINLSYSDVQVNQAYLAKESGDLVPADNSVTLGEKIHLVINLDKGWNETGGKSFIGASQKITTSNGTEILNSGDLFAAYDQTGIDATHAKVITLKARITSEPPTPVEYYLVDFRVWDKKGAGEIKGSYKFQIK